MRQWITLMNQMVFITSAFLRILSKASMLKSITEDSDDKTALYNERINNVNNQLAL